MVRIKQHLEKRSYSKLDTLKHSRMTIETSATLKTHKEKSLKGKKLTNIY